MGTGVGLSFLRQKSNDKVALQKFMYENNGFNTRRQVCQYDLLGNYITTYNSVPDAVEYARFKGGSTKGSASTTHSKTYRIVFQCLAHNYASAYGFFWIYLDELNFLPPDKIRVPSYSGWTVDSILIKDEQSNK